MTDLIDILKAYVEGRCDDREVEEVEALLLRYVDQDLDHETSTAIDRLIRQDETLAAIVAEARFGKTWFERNLQETLSPSSTSARPEASPELQAFVQALTTKTKTDAISSWARTLSRASWQHYAVAASIVLVLIGGWALQSVIGNRVSVAEIGRTRAETALKRRTAELTELRKQLNAQSAQLTDVGVLQHSLERELSTAEEEMQRLRLERTMLKARLETTLDQLTATEGKARESDRLTTILDDVKLIGQKALSSYRIRIDGLETKIDSLDAALTEALRGRERSNTELAASDLLSTALRSELAGLKQEVAALRATAASQAAELDARRRGLVALTAEMAELRSAQSGSEQEDVEPDPAMNAGPVGGAGMSDWTQQVAGYYSVYARQEKRHLVEITADRKDHIQRWLGEQLGRKVPIPDLSGAGMSFYGARLLVLDGMPVGQLTYLDESGTPIAFCLMRNMSGEAKALDLDTHGDVNLLEWSDESHQYVLVAPTVFAVLEALAQGFDAEYRADL